MVAKSPGTRKWLPVMEEVRRGRPAVLRGRRWQIVQAGDAGNDAGKCLGDGYVGRGGKMRLATDQVIVNGRVEGGFDLSGGAVECNPVAAASNLVDGEALRGEPGGKGDDIRRSDAEAVGEFLGREPFVIVGRAGVLLLDEELVEGGLLLGARGQDQHHAV